MQAIIFLLFIPAFLISIFFAWYIPGRILLGKYAKVKKLHLIVLSLVVGMVMWGWQGYVFGYLGMRFLSYAYIIFFAIYYIKKTYYKEFLGKKLYRKKFDFIAIFLILFGTAGQNIFYYMAGFFTSVGMVHVNFNPIDHYWHTSLINDMVKRFPPYEPGMYGIEVTNYHYWFNLITAELVRVFHLPLFHTQYQGMYILGSLLLGLTAYILAEKIYPSKLFANLLLFLLYFGGDATYIVTFFTRKVFDFTIPLIIDTGYIFMDNPPRAFSVIVGLAAIYLLFFYVDKRKKSLLFFITILFGSLVGYKIYTGIAFMGGLGLVALYQLTRREWHMTAVVFLATILSAAIFLPVNANSGGIMFLPFERPRDFITYKPLGFYDLELRWRVYLEHKNFLRLTQYGFMMTIIYIIAQFGVRVIGFIPYKATYKLLGWERALFFFGVIATSLLLGIFFSQKAHTADSFNFFLPAILILSILTSLTVALFCKGKPRIITIICIMVIVGVCLPRWIYRMNQELDRRQAWGFVGIRNEELASYEYLKKNTPKESFILVMNESSLDGAAAIVGIFSERNMYLSGQRVLLAHEVLNMHRVVVANKILHEKNPHVVNKLLQKEKIDYIYFYGNMKPKASLKRINAKKIFQNSQATIYKVEKK